MNEFTFSDFVKNRTKRTKRLLGWLTFCMVFLFGHQSFAQTVTIGTGTTTSTNVPTASCWAYSYSQQIYTAAQIGVPDGGEITKLRFYYTSGGTVYDNWKDWTVYVANTGRTSFDTTTDWESISNFTEVFSGEISVSELGGWFDINFSSGFDYDGGNLIIAVHENSPGFSCTPAYRITESEDNSSIYVRRDGTDYELSEMSSITATGRLAVVPQLQLVFASDVAPGCAVSVLPANEETGVVRNPTLTWEEGAGGPTNYDVYFGTDSDPALAANTTVTSYVPVAPLSPNTTYYWKVIPKNSIGDAQDCEIYSFTTGTGFQYCVPTGASNNTDEILNFTLNNLNNSSQASEGVNGYSDYSGTVAPAQVQAGVPTTASLTSGGGSGSHGAAIWIDYNQNGVFDTDEKVTFIGNTIAANATVDFPAFTVPADVTPGIYRLRVQYRYLITGEDLDPCVASQFSETEDYAVDILPVPSCLIPTGVSLEEVAAYTAEFSWNSVDNAEGYNWFVFENDADPETATPVESGSTTDTSVIVSGLTPQTAYDFYVKSDCGVTDGESNWSAKVDFTTLEACPTPTGLAHNQLSMSSTELSWVSEGNAFQLKWAEGDFDAETEGTLETVNNETSFTLENLIADVQYQFFVRQDCTDESEGYSDWAGPYNFSVGYCTPSSNAGSETYGDYIASFTTTGGVDNIDNTDSGYSAGGYGNFSASHSVSQAPGETISFSAVPGSTTYSRGLRIWVDWNNDGVFDESEIVYTSPATTTGTHGGSFEVPDVDTGDYRMRVILRWNATTTIGSCDTAFDGEAEDYTVTVIDPCAIVFAPEGDSEQILIEGQTLADLDVTGTNLTWYSDPELTNDISDSEIAEDGVTYYVTQTVGSCVSDALAITVEIDFLSTPGFEFSNFVAYPNPVRDILTLSNSQNISDVTVFNMLGQQVLSRQMESNVAEVDMTGLPSGNYLVRITSENVTKTVKVVKF